MDNVAGVLVDNEDTRSEYPWEQPGWIVMVGDDHAAIYWSGRHWTRYRDDAKIYGDWKTAKDVQKDLRTSHGSTHGTVATKSKGRLMRSA